MRTESALAERAPEIRDVGHSRVEEVHALLRRTMGAGGVEDVESFRKAVSPAADPLVVPAMVCGLVDGAVVGAAVGAYLVEPGLGFVSYGSVDEAWRRRGVYTALRGRLIERLRGHGTGRGRGDPAYVVSEMERGSFLFRRHVERGGAYAAPGLYEQPAGHGLGNRRMELVAQPIGAAGPPGREETLGIVRHVYRRIYRIGDVESHAVFIRVARSLAVGEAGR